MYYTKTTTNILINHDHETTHCYAGPMPKQFDFSAVYRAYKPAPF